jgi:hypothetical protein
MTWKLVLKYRLLYRLVRYGPDGGWVFGVGIFMIVIMLRGSRGV